MSQTRNKSRGLSSSALVGGVIVVGLILAAVVFLLNRPAAPGGGTTVEFPHVHGLGYSSDGSRLYVPAHIGLLVYENGGWSAPDLPAHDYMGYAASDDGFYSSGHPDLRTNFAQPLGLVKSGDEGRTLSVLAFEGESDFHLMGVGYESHAVYVVNPTPNSRLSAGLYYTLNDGQTWTPSRATGVSGSPIQLAVHPTDPAAVALVTQAGLYLSHDNGNTFELVGDTGTVTAAAFAPGGDTLLFGYQTLSVLDLSSGEVTALQSPSLTGDDAIAYIADNPVTDEIAFATFERNIYLSRDGGQSWTQIAAQGVGRS